MKSELITACCAMTVCSAGFLADAHWNPYPEVEEAVYQQAEKKEVAAVIPKVVLPDFRNPVELENLGHLIIKADSAADLGWSEEECRKVLVALEDLAVRKVFEDRMIANALDRLKPKHEKKEEEEAIATGVSFTKDMIPRLQDRVRRFINQIEHPDQAAVLKASLPDVKDYQREVLNSPLPVFVDYTAKWCMPCRSIEPVLENLAQKYERKVVFSKIDVDQNHALAEQQNVRGLPTFAFINRSQEVYRKTGLDPSNLAKVEEELATLIEKYLLGNSQKP